MRKQDLENLFAPSLKTLGYEVWGVELNRAAKGGLLRVYIEKEGGITIDDCAIATRQISSLLDVEDPIAGNYTLEVSSPGMNRPLYTKEQFIEFVGHKVKIKLRIMFEKRKNFEGILLAVENDEVILKLDDEDEEYCFPIESIDSAKLVANFDFSKNKGKDQ